jgi:putative MFS transporter
MFLASKRRYDDARKVLQTLFKLNRRIMTRDIATKLDFQSNQDSGYIEIFRKPFSFTTTTLSLCALSVNFVYYGSIYAIPDLATLPYDLTLGPSLFLGSVLEVPGCLFGIYAGSILSRKAAMQGYLLVSMVCLLAMSNRDTVKVGLFSLKFFSSAGWILLYLYGSEVYPTRLRTTGSGFCMACGRLGAIVAPIIFVLGKEIFGSSLAFFAIGFSLYTVSLVLVVQLPIETKDRILDASWE